MLEEASKTPGAVVVFRTHAECGLWQPRYRNVEMFPLQGAADRLRGRTCPVFFDHHIYDPPFEPERAMRAEAETEADRCRMRRFFKT